jgi:hypothetical protein
MTKAMRTKLARESFPEKIRKVSQLIRLVRNFPKAGLKDELEAAETRFK